MKILCLFLIIASATFSFNAHSDEHKKVHSTECKTDSQTSKNSGCYSNEKNKSPIPESIVCNVGGYSNSCFKEKDYNQKITNNIEKPTDFIAIESYRTAKEDLLTQQSMDDAATKMVVISIVSLVINIIGIILIWKNLVATKSAIAKAGEANTIASNANTLQLQPWLQIGEPKVSYMTGFSHDHPIKTALFRIEVPITNKGNTPVNWFAVDISTVTVTTHISGYGKATFTTGESESTGQFVHINAGGEHSSSNPIVMSLSSANSEDIQLPDGECWFDLKFQVRFKDVFTDSNSHRCLDVKSIRKYDWSNDKTIVRMNVGPETSCNDEGRFGLITVK